MATETFKKRQKERDRQEKRQKKAARMIERKNQKAKSGDTLEDRSHPPAAMEEIVASGRLLSAPPLP